MHLSDSHEEKQNVSGVQMKYYTIDQAVKRAYKNNEAFMIDNNMGFSRGIYNCVRMYFGCKPKRYYFTRKEKYDMKKVSI